jgi:hypothetical protein
MSRHLSRLIADTILVQTSRETMPAEVCKHCHGPKEVRNPTGSCDHLYWPDMLTDEAKRANGFRPIEKTVWIQE